jgi:hypothetical protein
MRSTYVWRDGAFVNKATGEPMETYGDAICAPLILSDTPAYMSPLGTGLIDGRAARREDLKRNNCREVDPAEWTPNEKYRERQERERS